MDALKAHIATQKRKSSAPDADALKYVPRGARERHEEAAREEKRPRTAVAAQDSAVRRRGGTLADGQEASPQRDDAEPAVAGELYNVSNEDAVRLLRQKGEPVRLFGESDKERRLRLRALELIEERGAHGRNDFMRALQGTDDKLTRERIEGLRATESSGDKAPDATASNPKTREGIGMNSVLDLRLMRRDLPRVYPIIYYTLKGLLSDWGDALARRPGASRRRAHLTCRGCATQRIGAHAKRNAPADLRESEAAL